MTISADFRNAAQRNLACLSLVIAMFAATPRSLRAQNAGPAARQPDSTTQGNPNGSGVVPPGVKLVPQRPGAATPKPFHFPPAATKTLPNGLRVFVVTDSSEPAVATRLVILSAGTIKDPATMPGVAQMTANLLTQGTTKRSAQQIADAIDFIGGSLNASADKDSTDISLGVVKKDLDTGLDLMSDVVLHPAFSADELDRQRQQLLSNFEVEYSDPEYLASAVFSRVVYGNSPYGWPAEGTPDAVRKLDRDALAKFHEANYAPNQALLAFAGDITPDQAFAAALKYFGAWPKSSVAADLAPALPAAPAGVHFWLVNKADAVQTQIRVGMPGVRRSDPNYLPLVVANRIFGGGYNSRLNTEVRVKKGLTYSAYSMFSPRRYAGSFLVGTYTRTEATVEATKLVVNLLSQMSTGDVTSQEMDFARAYLAGVYPIQSETADQVAGRVLTVAAYGLAADYNSSYPDKIRAITAQDVKAMAQKYMGADNLDIVLAGNVGAFRDALEKEFPSAKFDEIIADQIDLLAPDLRKLSTMPAPTPVTLEQGKQILLAAAKAAGGDALQSVNGLAMSEQEQMIGPNGGLPRTVTWSVAYPDRCRAEVQANGMSVLQVADGKSAWVRIQAQTHDATAMLGEFERGVALFGGGWGIYRELLEGKLQGSAIGNDEIDGKQVQGVAVQTRFGGVRLFFDPQTHLLAAARYESATSKGAADTEQRWSDYRTVDGRQFAFATTVYREGRKIMESSVQDLKINPPLAASLFSAPGQVDTASPSGR